MQNEIELLLKTNNEIVSVKSLLVKVIENFRYIKYKNALDLIPMMIKKFEWLLGIIEQTRYIEGVNVIANKFNTTLNEILISLQFEDYISVADLFEYEVLVIINEFDILIKDYIKNK